LAFGRQDPLMGRLRSYLGGHRPLATAVAGAAVLVVGAGIAYGVMSSATSTAVTSSPTTSPTTSPPATAAPGSAPGAPTAPSSSPARRRPRALRGRVTAMSSTAWTVQTAAGVTVTVEITPTTAFGSRAAPAAASSLAVGDEVIVVGARHGTTVTATRIAMTPATTPAPATAAV
jgi:hypothetical protein